jgi:hypothetical protein
MDMDIADEATVQATLELVISRSRLSYVKTDVHN